MDKKIIRDVTKYIKVISEGDLYSKKGCVINKNNDDNWLKVGKECADLYNTLFKIYSTIEKNSEDLEIVWGHGLLSFEINGEKIIHPMFSTKMVLNFNTEKAIFTLAPYNNITNFETGVLEGLDLPNFDKILDITLDVKNHGIDGRNLSDIEPLLINILNCLDVKLQKNTLNRDITPLSSIKVLPYPVFYNAPCIILRNIDTRLWDVELKDILNYIDNGNAIPKTIEALVKETNSLSTNDIYNEWEGIGKDILFPLPANEQQKEITKRLSNNFGVVVQGPPGTGKSHTICNLICHLMAHGKRVLVTSQTDKALKVLSEKIPEEIRSLCISLLGNDAKALKDLDESVRKITENLSIDPKILLQEAEPLENQLKKCRKDIQNLIVQLKEAESFESKTVTYRNETFTLTSLSKWIRENKDIYSWIDDNIEIKTRSALSEQDFNKLMKLIKENKKDDIDKLNKVKNLLYKLPSYDEIIEILNKIKSLEKNIDIYKKNIELCHIEIDEEGLEEFLKFITTAKEKIEVVENSWLKPILKSYYSNTAYKDFWKNIVLNLNNYVNQISVIKQIVNSHSIKFPAAVDLNKLQNDFKIIHNHIASKGKLSSMFKLFHSQCNYILQDCEVDYRSLNTKEQCDIFGKAIEKEILERNLKTLWNNTVKEYGGKVITNSDSTLLNTISENIIQIETIINWEDSYAKIIKKSLINSKFPIELNLHKKSDYDYLLKVFQSVKYIREYESLNNTLQNIRRLFIKNDYLSEAAEWLSNYDKVKIRKLYDELWKFKEMRDTADEMNAYINKLQNTCPLFTKKLLKEWETNSFKDIYKNWDNAWKWKAGSSLLNEIYKLKPEQLEQDIETETIRETMLIKEIVSKKTWYNQIMRTTESQKRSLFTWMESIKRIGKGTGKQSAKYRRLAQKEMESCKGVIPVWIMPLNKVIETIKLQDDLFDVVIVDESSQSDISAINVLLRGKRAVIVGDECQISPEAIGKDNELVENLIHRYLKDIPHNEWFDLKTSLYHTALRVFPSRLVLKEHFRCAPSIIGFSNDLCYSGEIIPLRCPEASDSFSPTVSAIKVSNGFKDSSKNVNEEEALAVVDKIVQCCNDDKYRNMTMGVISLLGESQSELIENILKEKLGIEEMINRRLICGDAYSFQGDERDIMFLTLVIAKNAKFTALTKESDIRRFNVAASRARNQMFLFHSVELEDLNSKCVRSHLLSYCLNSENKSLQYGKGTDLLVSGFKNDVFRAIEKRGFKVKSDVKIGKYKIDFVVEGSFNRIAVDCCGEDTVFCSNWEENHHRRMTLQRVGWKFFILRESEFYYSPENTIDKILHHLELNEV
jgi:superfamily I DNA and/or RNA helicase/very-short-patch-repair endonuclease